MSSVLTWTQVLPQLAAGMFFFLAAAVSRFLVLGMGLRPKRRALFLLISWLFGISGAAELLRAVATALSYEPLAVVTGLVLLTCFLILGSLLLLSASRVLAALKGGLEFARRRGQERFYAVVQAAPMAVVSTDCDGKITSWDPGAERIFGWKQEEILGTRAKTVPPERMTEQFALLDRALAGQVNLGFESERIHRDGRRFPVSISNAPLHDEHSSLIGIMATIEDISERKRIERELSEKSATLTAVTNALNTFLESGNYGAASQHLLTRALQRTQSEYGFLGVVLDGPVLRVLAHQGIVWGTEANHELYDAKLRDYAQKGFFEVALDQNLLGEVIQKGKTVVSNTPWTDTRSGGLPSGHPAMRSFLGVPILKGSTVVGVLAVSNRPNGYTGDEVRSRQTHGPPRGADRLRVHASAVAGL